jgi:hypothetical protein
LPRQFMIASAVGWFPGIVLFPLLLALFGETPSGRDWFHYGVTFAIAGLIATTYSYAIVVYLVACYGYCACWQMAAHYRRLARLELSGMQNRVRRVAILAGVLPLAAAVLLLAIGVPTIDQTTPTDYAGMINYMQHIQAQMLNMNRLHALVIALVILGAIGLYVVETASGKLIRVVRALTLADD